jgi:tetratricopeptide (TPR) repeat protein
VLPVLIVGMPRSGTSLVEQMLASHPQVHGAGELRDIGRLAGRLPGLTAAGRPYPECIAEVPPAALDELAALYTGRLAALGGTAVRVTDKMWQNYENLGLVELLVPRARVIHCRRDPLDTGLSCYLQSFGAAGPPFSYDLAHIGAYLREYQRLMAHWRRVSGLRLLEVDYETLVDDPEGQARRLVAFLELDWHAAVLDFHANPRVVRTASSAQVRRPIYRSAVGRHRRYQRQLAPLREALEDSDAARRNRQGERLGAAGRVAEAMQAFAEAARLDPGHVAARRNLGIGHMMLGRPAEAEAEFRAVIEAAPGASEAWHHLAGVHEARGETGRAIECLERVAALEPASAAARNNLGAARLNQGDTERAEALFREALERDPAYAPGWRNLSRALLAGGRLEQALEAAGRAVRLAPADAAAHALAGSIRHALGDDRRAAEDFGRALQLDPAQPAALAGRARLLEADGRVAEALALLESQPPAAEVVLARARLLRHIGDHAAAVAALEALRAAPRLAHGSRAQLEFALGHARAGLGEHERAFGHYRAGNAMRRAGFDAAAHARGVNALIASFSRAALDRLPRSAVASEQPVFVVGMPRAGKSIVEQILASHPRLHGAGETRFLGEISFKLRQALGDGEPYPMCVARATQDALTTLAAGYLASVGAPREALRVTDTLPTNFLHVGLVELLFPHARIVHCLRDPDDVAWACYCKDFLDPGFAFASDLDDIRAFQADYARLMAHWQEVSRLPIVEIRYETLVRDTARESRRLVEAIGLAWDERCLRYHEPGVPDLRSARSVSEPLDERDIGSHRPYAGWMR